MGVYPFGGPVGTISAGATDWVFAGPTVSLTVAAGQKLVGSAQVPLGKTTATRQSFAYGLCYRTGTTMTNFLGYSYSIAEIDSSPRRPYAAAASASPAAGTYTVGYCVRNGGADPLDNNDYVSGWVLLTN